MATFEADGSWFPKVRGPYVLYLRFSDRPHTRLNVASQRKAVAPLLCKGRAHKIAEFVETEPRQGEGRIFLEEAIEVCRDQGATLILGKVDRLRGRIKLLDRLFNQRVKFRCADLPHLYSSTLYQLKRDESERQRMRGDRIREGLAKARAEGVSLSGRRENSEGLKKGPAKSLEKRRWISDYRGRETWRLVKGIRDGGVSSLTEIAAKLNELGHRAPRGGPWSPNQVRRVVRKFEAK